MKATLLSLHAGQTGKIIFNITAPEGADTTLTGALLVGGKPEFMDTSTPGRVYVPPVMVGCHLYEIRCGGVTVLHGELDVTPSPLCDMSGERVWEVDVDLTQPLPVVNLVFHPGPAGRDGKSAYELACDAGFEGSIEEWLKSLKGEALETAKEIDCSESPLAANAIAKHLPTDVFTPEGEVKPAFTLLASTLTPEETGVEVVNSLILDYLSTSDPSRLARMADIPTCVLDSSGQSIEETLSTQQSRLNSLEEELRKAGGSGTVDSEQLKEAVNSALGEAVVELGGEGDDNMNCMSIELAPEHAPEMQVAAIRLLARSSGAVSGEAVYLSAWEQQQSGEYTLAAVSENTQVQAIGEWAEWRFDKLELRGRRMRYAALPTPDTDFAQACILYIRCRERGVDDSCILHSSEYPYYYHPAMQIVPRGRYAPISHVGDESHITAAERAKWNAYEQQINENADSSHAGSGTNSTQIGEKANASGAFTVAIASSAEASANRSVSIGNDSKSTGLHSSAIGYAAKATAVQATATGANTSASGASSTATGCNAKATKDDSTATGVESIASGVYATGTGAKVKASGEYSTSTGSSSQSAGLSSSAYGAFSQANNDFTTALGAHAINNNTGTSVISAETKIPEDNIVRTQLYLIAAGSDLSNDYLAGEAGLGYITYVDQRDRMDIIASGCRKLSELLTSAAFSPTAAISIDGEAAKRFLPDLTRKESAEPPDDPTESEPQDEEESTADFTDTI